MKSYTENEVVEILKPQHRYITLIQYLYVAYWAMFEPKRINRLCYNFERGMHAFAAFDDAKKWEEVK